MEQQFNRTARLAQVNEILDTAGESVECKVMYSGPDITVEVITSKGKIIVECGEGYTLEPLRAIVMASDNKLSYLSQLEFERIAMCAWHMAIQMPLTLELTDNAIFIEIKKSRSTVMSLVTFEGIQHLSVEFPNTQGKYLFPASDRESYKEYIDEVICLYIRQE